MNSLLIHDMLIFFLFIYFINQFFMIHKPYTLYAFIEVNSLKIISNISCMRPAVGLTVAIFSHYLLEYVPSLEYVGQWCSKRTR